MSNMSRTLKVAQDAIDKLFADTAVDPATTEEWLKELQADIETKLDALKCDRKRKEALRG